MAITWPLLFLKPFQALVGRMTQQSVLSGFIPLRRKGDVGKHWHLEMTAFFTDHYPECPLYSSERQLILEPCLRKKRMFKRVVSHRGIFGRIYWNVNITDFRGSSCSIKVSVWYVILWSRQGNFNFNSIKWQNTVLSQIPDLITNTRFYWKIIY